ncbi:alpha/beta hydrolase [Lutibacter citreus]|uniref:alpha/beta hydrolase n=1 Tax=Lutibacter citreus TaxID=2138210 RepID=UPI000DBE033A|nr:alpha/beta hydrolase [Lutibacter citreus]
MSKTKNSTKPINNGMQIPKIIIVLGHTLQAISHSLATLYAIKLFKTPFKFKTPLAEKTMENNTKKKIVSIPEINKEIMVYTYGNSKKKVLLVHGWSGRGTQLFSIANKLVENGYMTISFDAPAHGKSKGKSTMMPEFISCILQLEKEFGPFEIAIGHSLGAMAVLNSIKKGLNVKKAITIGAGDIITDIIINFIEKIDLKPIIVQKMKIYYLKKFNFDIDTLSASVAAKQVKIPILVIHDNNDKEVSVNCAYNIDKNLENGETFITNNLGHTRILKDKTVVQRVLEFILQNDQSSN